MPTPTGDSMFRALHDSVDVLALGHQRWKRLVFSELMPQCRNKVNSSKLCIKNEPDCNVCQFRLPAYARGKSQNNIALDCLEFRFNGMPLTFREKTKITEKQPFNLLTRPLHHSSLRTENKTGARSHYH